MVHWAPITGLSDSCSPPLWRHLHLEREPMADRLRILLAPIELSPRTPWRKQWSTAHNLRASLCIEEGAVLSVREVEVILGHKNFFSPAVLKFSLFWDDCVVSCPFWYSYWGMLNSEADHRLVYHKCQYVWRKLSLEPSHDSGNTLLDIISQSSNQNINCAAVLGFTVTIPLRGVH